MSSYHDAAPEYERRRYDDERDTQDHRYKRQRSPSPPYGVYRNGAVGTSNDDRTYHNGAEKDVKRLRQQDEQEYDYNGSGAGRPGTRSPEQSRRGWDDLEPEEKEREWQRYEREREWDHYYATRGGGARAGDADSSTAGPRARLIDQARPGRDPYEDPYSRSAYDGARPGKASAARTMDPMDSPTILPFKRFTQLLREAGKEPVAQQTGADATQTLFDMYQDYRQAFHRRAMEQFWQVHRDEKWFQERYGLDEAVVQARNLRKKAGRAGKKKGWLDELRQGQLDKVCWEVEPERALAEKDGGAPSSSSSALVARTRFGEREVMEDSETVNLPAEANQLLIRSIPVEIGRSQVEEILRDCASFRYLALGEPHSLKRFGRIGVVVFDDITPEERDRLSEDLSQQTVAGQRLAFEVTKRPAQAKLRIAPEYASTLTRMLHDARQARQSIALLESEDRESVFNASEGGEEGKEEADEAIKTDASELIIQRAIETVSSDADEQQALRSWLNSKLDDTSSEDDDAPAVDPKDEESSIPYAKRKELVRVVLDLHIDLLRQVYNCDYYSSTICDFPEELVRRVPKSLRKAHVEASATDASLQEKDRLWASNVDSKHLLFLRPNDDEIGSYGGRNVYEMLLEQAAPYSREDEAEKHRCIVKLDGETECGKPFKAQIFVQKHVLNKHREWFQALMAERIADARLFNNYVRDPQRPMPPLQAHSQAVSSASLQDRAGGPLGARVGAYDPYGGSAGTGSYYGTGGMLRIGATQPAHVGNGNGARARLDDGAQGLIRIGASSVAGGIPLGPMAVPKPLDPRAAMAPKSYQDLDAGVPSGAAEIELEY